MIRSILLGWLLWLGLFASLPVSAQMPAGHPPGGARRPEGEIALPENSERIDPSLPPGTVVVTVHDVFGEPVKGQAFRLLVNHQSVAKGEAKERLDGVTDDAGNAVFSGLSVGSGHGYRVTTSRGPAAFQSGDFGLGPKGGVRVLIHVFDSTADLNEAGILGKSTVTITLKEDVLVVEVQATFLNRSMLAWQADRRFALPKGSKAFTTPDGMMPTVVAEGEEAVLKGTVVPGEINVAFRFHIPIETDGDQIVELPLLPNMAAMAVRVEASKSMKLTLPGFADPVRIQDRTGKSFLETRKQITVEDYTQRNFLGGAVLTIEGMPRKPTIVLFLAGLVIAAFGIGVVYAIVQQREGAVRVPLEDLEEAREALLIEFAELRRATAKGLVGPKTYERTHQHLLDALARILDQIRERRAHEFGGNPPPTSDTFAAYGQSTEAGGGERAPDGAPPVRAPKERRRRLR